MTHDISDLDEALAGLTTDEMAGSLYFEACLQFLGTALAKQFLQECEEGLPGTIRIVCSSEDYDMLALPFAQTLRGEGISCWISCLWSKYNGPTEHVPATSLLVAQAHNDGPRRVDAIVNISCSLIEEAIVADNLSRIAGKINAESHYILSPFMTGQDVRLVRDQMDYRGSVQPTFVDLTTLLNAEPPQDLLPFLRRHLRIAYGRDRVAFVPMDFGGNAPTFISDPPKFNI